MEATNSSCWWSTTSLAELVETTVVARTLMTKTANILVVAVESLEFMCIASIVALEAGGCSRKKRRHAMQVATWS